MSEGQLLARFVETKDEAAFEALVSRFGPMVLGVCRQVLNDSHAADDAFQATFLVLVRRAKSIRDRDLLGNWLYGVALKVARRSRADRAKRTVREAEVQAVPSEPVGDDPSREDFELGPTLHEELARLPEKYRAPMVLCFLEGHTCEEAAGRLGWPVGTVKGRISRAKDLLRGRLARRGVTATTALVAATLTKAAEASVSPILLDQTVKAAMGLAAGGAAVAAGLASASAVALADGVGMTMMISKLKVMATAAALVATLATGAGVMARQFGAGGQGRGEAKPKAEVATKTATAEGPALGVTPDKPVPAFEALIADTPLPALDAMPKLLAARVVAAKEELDAKATFYNQGSITLDRLVQAATSYRDARMAIAGNRAYKIKANEDHVRLLQRVAEGEKQRFEVGQGSRPNVVEAESARLEAMIALARERDNKDEPTRREPATGGRGDGKVGAATVAAKTDLNAGAGQESDDPEGDAEILKVLGRPIPMAFAEETPLEDFVKYIKTTTQGPKMADGLPIYIDPDGLSQADKTLASPIRLSLDGIKLKTSLRLVTKQLGMGYYVKHGLVIITNLDDDDYKDATQPGWRAREAADSAKKGGFQ